MDLSQFKDWAISQGQVGNPNPNNTYLGQCVSLIQQYINKVYGIPWTPRGDAKDWSTNTNVLSYFDKVSSPQAGDIGVMGSDYGNGFGHIFIYLTPNTILEQNGRVPLKVSTGSAYNNPIAILRRKENNMEKKVSGDDSYNVTNLFNEPDRKRFDGQAWSAVFYYYITGKVQALQRSNREVTEIADTRDSYLKEIGKAVGKDYKVIERQQVDEIIGIIQSKPDDQKVAKYDRIESIIKE